MKKLTDKQKSRLWELQRNRNFQASRRLEGVEMPLVTLTAAEALAEAAGKESYFAKHHSDFSEGKQFILTHNSLPSCPALVPGH